MLEVFNNLFMAVAEEMGVALQNTASSVNIKERLDFSCALFDSGGALIANAPHIPVHLGSMGDSIRTIIEARGEGRDGRGIREGDVYVLNAPYRGGTHLPDITVIMPVFAEAGDPAPAWYVAARGHHADIGGIAPGSMPPDSHTIDEEGVLIDNALLVDEGRFLEAEMRALLASGPWPARRPDRNISDLKAQVAACARGRGGDAAGGGRIWPRRGRRLHGPCPGQCRGGGAAADRLAAATATSATRWTMAPRSASASGSIREPLRDRRLHRHQRPAAEQFQRALFDLPGGDALRLPHPGRRPRSR